MFLALQGEVLSLLSMQDLGCTSVESDSDGSEYGGGEQM